MSKLSSRCTKEIFEHLLGESGVGDQLREYSDEEARLLKREMNRIIMANFDDIEEKAWMYDELQF